MFGFADLKENIAITEGTVECPVKCCNLKVARQHIVFKTEDRFKCPKHNIYISPSTFEYHSELDNILWKDKTDIDLLDRTKIVKRESRMARDNSEDALTWNVFRFLEKENLIGSFLRSISKTESKPYDIIYWSYSQREASSWSELNKTRTVFGEAIKNSSEPDIIVNTDNALFFIEAKLTANNETTPSDTTNTKKYETGADNWFTQVFFSNYKKIAIDDKKYELLRFWLLGTWLAAQLRVKFYLVNLVLEEREVNIEDAFNKHINRSNERNFIRISWESIYQHLLNSRLSSKNSAIMKEYFLNKTLGYDGHGRLQRAFSLY